MSVCVSVVSPDPSYAVTGIAHNSVRPHHGLYAAHDSSSENQDLKLLRLMANRNIS